ncbi:hypothetical protein GS399_13615 [Pedobacter sp. HMF7647]|uniref:Uncharacterized protein n=1 Tax=Hufsiella arboris TaxID=2695275 RepID=A0A7K1YBP3_9SPHI|nr:hypothetical protein [Hufsiella arboris]MXV52014.1 hypothetical protein [Hufsiella arboris]
MTKIRSLADELREKMRQQPGIEEPETAKQSQPNANNQDKPVRKKAGKPPPEKPSVELEILFAELTAYELTGNEKLLIRLDGRTVFMLKQLKVTKSIDMNKLIAYSLDSFFKERPELINYIKASLQTIEL